MGSLLVLAFLLGPCVLLLFQHLLFVQVSSPNSLALLTWGSHVILKKQNLLSASHTDSPGQGQKALDSGETGVTGACELLCVLRTELGSSAEAASSLHH